MFRFLLFLRFHLLFPGSESKLISLSKITSRNVKSFSTKSENASSLVSTIRLWPLD